MIKQAAVRPSPLAGRWYPETAEQLGWLVDQFLGEPVQVDSPPYGVLAPHAGMNYSGAVAGKAFRYSVGLDVDLVVVVAPSHQLYPAALLSTAHQYFETPLGQIPVATHLIDLLEQKVPLLRVANDREHAIEIELPFLQRTLKKFELVPLAMLEQSWQAAQQLGETLASLVHGRKVLLVASSDLSHFKSEATAKQLDQTLLDAVAAYDPEQVIQLEVEGRGFACGRGAIAAVMVAAQGLGAKNATIVGYGTSGDVSGNKSAVVGYGAALFN